MNKPDFTKHPIFNVIDVQTYERYLPSAFDGSLTMLQKINKIIYHLNDMGTVTSDIVLQWNKMIEWILGSGLYETVEQIIDDKINDGTFNNLFDSIVGSLDDLETDDKSLIVNAINEIHQIVSSHTTNLEKMGAIENLITNDKKTVVDAINEVKTDTIINRQAPTTIGESTGSGVLSGLKVRQQTVLAMAVEVGNNIDPNIIHMKSGIRYTPKSTTLPVNDSHPTLDRMDIIYVSATGNIEYLQGIAANTPVPPTLPDGGELLAHIIVKANDTSVNNSDIVDKRSFKNLNELKTENQSNLVQAINEIVDTINDVIVSLGDVIENETNVLRKEIGDFDNLQTKNNNTIVEAINELVSIIGDNDVLDTDVKTNLVESINEIVLNMGDIGALSTSNKLNIIEAINELAKEIGDVSTLDTKDKISVVSAVNNLVIAIGSLEHLTTTNKDNIVSAMNSIVNDVTDLMEIVENKVEKNSQVINVRDYGAMGDGVTDDTQALRNVVAMADGKKTIYLPRGTYLCRPLVLPSNTTIIGDGIDITTLKLMPNADDALLVVAEQHNVTLKDFTVDGNKDNQIKGSSVIFWRSRYNLINSLKIINSYTIGLEMSNVTDSIIENSHFDGTVENCVVSFSNDNADYVTGNNIIRNNIMENAGLDGIIYNTMNGIITNNIFRNNGKRVGWTAGGVYANKKYFLIITNNTIYGNNGNGVDLIDCGNCIISGNVSRENNSAGIMLANCSNSTIENNICANNGKAPALLQDDGITILNTSHHLIISGNRCFNSIGTPNQIHGLHIMDNAYDIIVTGNNFENNQLPDGIKLEPNTSDIMLIGNKPFNKDFVSYEPFNFSVKRGETFPLLNSDKVAVVEILDKNLQSFGRFLLRGTEKKVVILENPIETFDIVTTSVKENLVYHDGQKYVLKNNHADNAYYNYKITYIS